MSAGYRHVYTGASELLFKDAFGSCFHAAAHWATTALHRGMGARPQRIVNTNTRGGGELGVDV